MKKILFIFIWTTLLIFVGGKNNFVYAYDSVTFVNATGRTIYYVYFVPNHYENWGSDRLIGVWNSGNSLTLDSSYWRYWALKIVFEGGEYAFWSGNNPIDAQTVWKGTIVPNGNGNYTLIHN